LLVKAFESKVSDRKCGVYFVFRNQVTCKYSMFMLNCLQLYVKERRSLWYVVLVDDNFLESKAC